GIYLNSLERLFKFLNHSTLLYPSTQTTISERRLSMPRSNVVEEASSLGGMELSGVQFSIDTNQDRI
ncbi:MAG: hypothetical protein Q8J62_03440, partial [Candidatus Cloacimonadaceae bacterium]|nr:hypothetical protein [Candidatus Cloacimonadaceae bacterium]